MSKLGEGLIIAGVVLLCAVVAFLVMNKSGNQPTEQEEADVVAHGGHGGHHSHHGHHGHRWHHNYHGHHGHHGHRGHHYRDYRHGYWNGGGVWGNNPGYYYDPNYYYNVKGRPSYTYIEPVTTTPVVQPVITAPVQTTITPQM